MSDNIARDALAVLDGGKNWHKGSASNEYGTKFCAVGAINEIVGWNSGQFTGFDLVNYMEDVAKEQFPDRINTIICMSPIAQVNDHYNTTWEDIERIFEKAAAWIDEQA